MRKIEGLPASQILKSSIKDKEEHIRICLEKDVESTRSTGFENFYLVNNPLPEINFEDIDISCEFLGKKILAPFIISYTFSCVISMSLTHDEWKRCFD